MSDLIFDKEISIVISGEAGQGVDTVSNLLLKAIKDNNYNVFATKEYMSRVRGGINSTQIRISSNNLNSYCENIDILVVLDKKAFQHLKNRINKNTIIITDPTKRDLDFDKEAKIVEVPINDTAKEIGSALYSNTISAGIIAGLLELPKSSIDKILTTDFAKKGEEIIQKNIVAAAKGQELAQKIKQEIGIEFSIEKDSNTNNKLLITGTEAVGLGCISGGCNFISSYPMSPGTGVLTFLAKSSEKLDILVEQVEDEIAAINMAIGAWYTGARAMVTTSGGGFALMCEGVSLSGMIESPIVIHIGQRPGPATGLPTRTEQGDLELALYSGHGEFPRAIFAPGNMEEAYEVSQKAFNIADKYQIPTFILTDQYLLDSHAFIDKSTLEKINIETYITEATPDYKRYKLSENPVSPRAIPSFGEGFVTADSDEHDEYGNITEDLEIRVKMQDKRLAKLPLIEKDALAPSLYGNENYKTLIIGWGSTLEVINEALEKSKNPNLAHLHYKQVYPINPNINEYIKKAEKVIIVENNATSQFGKLIKLATGKEADVKILKYNGMPFSIEELTQKFIGA